MPWVAYFSFHRPALGIKGLGTDTRLYSNYRYRMFLWNSREVCLRSGEGWVGLKYGGGGAGAISVFFKNEFGNLAHKMCNEDQITESAVVIICITSLSRWHWTFMKILLGPLSVYCTHTYKWVHAYHMIKYMKLQYYTVDILERHTVLWSCIEYAQN